MKKLLLGQGDDGKILHAEKRRRGAQRIFRIDHDNASLAQPLILFDEGGDIDVFGEDVIRHLQIGLEVVDVLEQMLYRPEGIDVGTSARQ